jgi:hypothetical protein
MSKGKDIHWEPDVKKGMDDLKHMKERKESLKEDADRRKIDGFNPGDVSKK